MTKKQTIRQRKSKETRKKLYEYLMQTDEFLSVKQLEIALKISHAVAYHHVQMLMKEKYIVWKKVTENRVTTLMVKASGSKLPDDYASLEVPPPPAPPEKPSHIRVVKLLDNPIPRPQESKKKVKVHIGSGMTLFNNY